MQPSVKPKPTTKKEAEAQALAYAEPKECFIEYTGTAKGWRSLQNSTPCAHYVSHILNIKSTASTGGYGCADGYELRVRALVEHLKEIPLNEVQVHDVWARLKGDKSAEGSTEPTDHCGMVIKVGEVVDEKRQITIRHNSSGQQKVAENDWKFFKYGGKFYRSTRVVAAGAVIPPSVQENMERADAGRPLRSTSPAGGGVRRNPDTLVFDWIKWW